MIHIELHNSNQFSSSISQWCTYAFGILNLWGSDTSKKIGSFFTKVDPHFRSKTYSRYLIQNSFPDFLLDAQWEMMHTPLASLIFTRGHIKCYFLAVMCREKTDTQGLVFLFRSSWNAQLKNNKNNNNNGSVLHKCQKHSLFSSVFIIIKQFLGKIQKH